MIVLLSVLGLAVLLVTVFVFRRRNLARSASSFDCSLLVGEGHITARRRHWRLGVAVYAENSLDWYPVFSLARRPAHTFPRQALEITGRREPDEEERYATLPESVIVDVAFRGAGAVHLAMAADACTGLSSWLEAAPPGHNDRMGRFT